MRFNSQSNKRQVFYPQLGLKSRQVKSSILRQPSSDIGTYYMAGFLHHEEVQHEQKLRKAKMELSRLPRSLGAKSPNVLSKKFGRKMIDGRQCSQEYSEEDEIRLATTRTQFLLKSNQARTNLYKSPYIPIKGRGGKRLLNEKKQIRSRLLEIYFEMNRSEREASITIQVAWRSILAKRKMHNLGRQRLSAIHIQAGFRGSRVRSQVKKWEKNRHYHIPRCQARFRRRLARLRWEIILIVMHKSATYIQRPIRCFLARRFIQTVCQNNAAMDIQMFYRTRMLNFRVYQRFERNLVVVIQKIMRSKLARAFVASRSIAMNNATIQIQKCWRGHVARAQRSAILVNKCSAEIRKNVLILGTEIEYYTNDLEKMMEISKDKELSQKIDDAKTAYAETRTSLHTSEQNSIELKRMKANMTPASVSDGWEEQVNHSLLHERTMKTKLVLDIVLNLGMNVSVLHRRLQQSRGERLALEETIARLKEERYALRKRLQDCQLERSKREAALNQRKAVADEIRKWKVNHRTSDGKPMKKILTTAPALVVGSGSINSLAENEVIPDLVDTIALKSHLGQVEHLKGMLKPIEKFCQ